MHRMTQATEKWLPIVGHEDTHEVSDQGRVRCLHGPLVPAGRFESGYSRINIAGKSFRLHRLVLAAFRGPCPEGMEGAHENGVKADCRLSNLAWKTRLANHADKQRHGTTARGVRHGLAKLNVSSVLAIRESSASASALSRQYGVSRPIIRSVQQRKTWKHV